MSVVDEFLFENLHEEIHVLPEATLRRGHILPIIVPRHECRIEIADQGIVLVPAELAPGNQLREIRIIAEKRRQAVFHELHVRIPFLIGRIEFVAGIFYSCGCFVSQGRYHQQHEQVERTRRFTRYLKLRFGFSDAHGRIFSKTVENFESLYAENSSV